MKPYIATIILSFILMAMSAWGYFGSSTPSTSALIPMAWGIMLLLCSYGVKKENKIVAHIAIFLVVLLALALFMPLKGAIGRGDMVALARVSIMEIALVSTLVVYIRSFIQARRDRKTATA
jgi:uncharacterized membrane protein